MELQIHKMTGDSISSDVVVPNPLETDVIKAIEEVLDYTHNTTTGKKTGYVTLTSSPSIPTLKAISSQLVIILTGGYIDLGTDGGTFLQLEATQLYWTIYLRTERHGPVLNARRNSLSSVAVLKDCFTTYLNRPGALPELDWVPAPHLK